MSVFLLAPQLGRLSDFYWHNHPAALKREEPLFRSVRANRIAIAVQVVMWIWILGNQAYQTRSGWYEYGPGRPKPPLYGIWDVTGVTQNGTEGSPQSTDGLRWKRIVFDYPNSMAAQHLNDEFERFSATVNTQKMSLAL